jgi:uncharacterized protein (DUF1501 family)
MPRPTPRCPGTFNRRSFLRAGAAALGGLSLADLLRLEAQSREAQRSTSPKSVIVLWLWGGASHMETFDLKPDAPSEYRGDFRPIHTNIPGLDISEHLPRLARLGDKFALIRSLHHNSPGHVNSTHTLLSAYPGDLVEGGDYKPRYPFVWSVANKMLGERRPGLPQYVAMPRVRYQGAAYLGRQYEPLVVSADPSTAGYQPPDISLAAADRPRFGQRAELLRQFDGIRRDLDQTGAMEAMDGFQRRAADILTSGAAREAFDLTREDGRVRDRYGRHAVGQRCLLARRLIEAGTRIVTIDFPCVPGQKAFSWDDHASVWNIFEQMRIRLPVLDQVVSALIEDLHMRGLADDTLLIVTGEMSHTPRLNYFNGQPGREHWARSMSLLLAGGGLRMGQAVGATNSRGEEPRVRPITPNDFQATLYRWFGIPLETSFLDHAGRPVHIVPNGRVIEELV